MTIDIDKLHKKFMSSAKSEDMLSINSLYLDAGYYSDLHFEIDACIDLISFTYDKMVKFNVVMNDVRKVVPNEYFNLLDDLSDAFESVSYRIPLGDNLSKINELRAKVKAVNAILDEIVFLKKSIDASKDKKIYVKLRDVATSIGISPVVCGADVDNDELDDIVRRALIKYGLIVLEYNMTEKEEVPCICVGHINMEVDRVKLANLIDKMTRDLDHVNGTDLYMTPKVQETFEQDVRQLAELFPNWNEFI